MKTKRNKTITETNVSYISDRAEIAFTAMRGILSACASPQFYDRLDHIARMEPKQDLEHVIAEMAFDIADFMVIESAKRKVRE